MRRLLFKLLLLLLLAAVLGTLIAYDPGYLLLVWRDASLETSLWFGLLLFLLLWWLLRLLAGAMRWLLDSRGSLAAWRQRRQQRRVRQETASGLLALVEGEWQRARQELDVAVAHADTPVLNRLGAAWAAHEMGDSAARDDYLEAARVASPKAELAVGLSRAKFLIAEQQWEQALATLLTLRKQAPRNAQLLRLLRSTYEALEDWQALVDLLPDLRQAGLVTDAASSELEQQVWCAELHRAARIDADREGRQHSLEQAWHRVPKALRRQPRLILAQVRELCDLGAESAAEKLLRASLLQNFDDDLLLRYGWVAGEDPAAQLAEAEAWLPARPNNPALLLTLGRLALRVQHWDKAREYFEACVAQQRSVEAEAELGRLLRHLGEHEAASRHLARAIRQLPALLPDLPMPEGE